MLEVPDVFRRLLLRKWKIHLQNFLHHGPSFAQTLKTSRLQEGLFPASANPNPFAARRWWTDEKWTKPHILGPLVQPFLANITEHPVPQFADQSQMLPIREVEKVEDIAPSV